MNIDIVVGVYSYEYTLVNCSYMEDNFPYKNLRIVVFAGIDYENMDLD